MEKQMGTVYTEITLKNSSDLDYAKDGYIKPEEVRTATVTAIVDTGAMYPVITEELFQQLGLSVKEERTVHIANSSLSRVSGDVNRTAPRSGDANGQQVPCYLTNAVEVTWKDRKTDISAVVIPGAKKILLGVIPMEAMDLMINPRTQEVVGAHGDHVELLALQAFA